MQEDLLVLQREPAVSHAYHSLDSLANGNLLLRFHIEENSTLIPAVDLWQTVNNSFAYHLGVTDYNFSGRGYTVGGFYRQNNFPGFGLLLENNNFLTAETELKLLVQQLETLEPILTALEIAQYRYRFQSIDLNLGREINFKHKILLGGGIIGERYLFNDGVDVSTIPNRFTTVKGVAKGATFMIIYNPFITTSTDGEISSMPRMYGENPSLKITAFTALKMRPYFLSASVNEEILPLGYNGVLHAILIHPSHLL